MREKMQELLTKDALKSLEDERFNLAKLEEELMLPSGKEVAQSFFGLTYFKRKKLFDETIWNDASGEEDNLDNSGQC